MELNGHNIVILREPRIVSIDGVPHSYGIAGDCYYLERNPRDRAETLLGAVRHYLDYVISRPEPLPRAC